MLEKISIVAVTENTESSCVQKDGRLTLCLPLVGGKIPNHNDMEQDEQS